MGPATSAQPGPRLTAWRAADGLPQSSVLGVTLDAQDRAITTHGPGFPVARFDGFQITTLSNTLGAPTRVHVSRSEQLWAVSPSGLVEQVGQGWNSHPVAPIAAEFRANPIRSFRPIPILPMDRNRVLVLLPDRLIEYNSGERRTTLIRAVTNTPLSRFTELTPSRDDGAWIAGDGGLLRVPGPLRHIAPETVFQAYPTPEDLRLVDLQRPFEDEVGAVVMAAEDADSGLPGVARLADGTWGFWPVPGHNLRQAWPGPDGDLWGHTLGALLRLDFDRTGLRPQTILQVGRIADLAIEPHGAAWLATSDGLFRVAPLPWRPAQAFRDDAGPVLTVTSDRFGQLVAATPQEVHRRIGSDWEVIPLPGPPRDELPPRGPALFALPNGDLLIRGVDEHRVLGADRRLRKLPDELSKGLPLGTLADGRVVFRSGTTPEGEFVAYDGAQQHPLAPPLPNDADLGALAFALQTRTGELWVGGDRGLAVRRGVEWEIVETDANDDDDGALAGCELLDGRLLIGGRDAIREFDGRQWRVLRRAFDRVHSLQLARDGSVWVASGSGLYRFKDQSWLGLGEEEGLPSAAVFTVFEDGTGNLWAGSGRGLSHYDPHADTDAPQAEIAEADLPEPDGEARALFVLGGVDRWRYTSPGRLLFAWRLDNNPWSFWRPAGSVQFTNLTAGTHRFFVRSQDPSGNVQALPAQFEFNVSLPWFKDPRLVAALAALALVLIAMGFQALISYWRLRRSYAEVERQVAERSAALEKANAELLHSHKMRALGTLAAGVAHDFNNLLSIIRGSAQLLERQLDDPSRTRQRLQRIVTAVDQGAGLVRAMLGYSRGSAAPRKPLDPVEVVQRAVRLVDERLQGRLAFTAPDQALPKIEAPLEMLQQILLNLIQNADEAMEHRGPITVELQLRNAPPPSVVLQPEAAPAYVVLVVRDQGIGIPPENISRIFEPFFTTKGFSSRRGTGLGLSMVYEFAKELGAGIAVESGPGQGSAFQILLPVRHGT